MSEKRWDVRGKRCLVTGGTSGIGEATAAGLLRAGAEVTLVVRSRVKAEATRESLQKKTGNAAIEIVLCDFASFASIRRATAEILDRYPRIDVLVNNAGIVNLKREETRDGIEATFGVNHLGYFLFTRQLLERLRESAPSRIVNVASHAHKFSKIDFDDLQAEKNWGSMAAYGRSKGCNILFTRELARLLDGSGVTANALHPGGVSTGLGSNNQGLLASLIQPIAMLFMKSAAKGARTSIYLATSDEVSGKSGGYFANCREASSSPQTQDDALARRLWAISEELCALEATATSA
ncbi:MAG: SDR family oxidoreductase [Deltaproteobacteria bacterium]